MSLCVDRSIGFSKIRYSDQNDSLDIPQSGICNKCLQSLIAVLKAKEQRKDIACLQRINIALTGGHPENLLFTLK